MCVCIPPITRKSKSRMLNNLFLAAAKSINNLALIIRTANQHSNVKYKETSVGICWGGDCMTGNQKMVIQRRTYHSLKTIIKGLLHFYLTVILSITNYIITFFVGRSTVISRVRRCRKNLLFDNYRNTVSTCPPHTERCLETVIMKNYI